MATITCAVVAREPWLPTRLCVYLSVFVPAICSLDLSHIVIVVRSQPNSFHVKRAEIFKDHIDEQLQNVDKEELYDPSYEGVLHVGEYVRYSPKKKHPSVYLMHTEWPEVGSWTILPLIPDFAQEFSSKLWLLICEDETRLDLSGLLAVLQRFDPSKDHFLGQALQDSQPVITHHFAFAEDPSSFSYPDLAAGVIFSLTLIKRLAEAWDVRQPETDFTIDIQHELAMFLWNDGKGLRLTDVPELCAGDREKSSCVTTYPQHFPDCGKPVAKEDLFVGVKTCDKFHKDRVPVVKKTWYKDADLLEFYSETEDSSIPTIDLGVPNTERGHCGKTLAILRRIFNDPEKSKKPWVLIADDDTIISLPRLRALLACYNPDEPVALGERYAFGVIQRYGYDYITGGGGMVFSRLTAHQLIDSGLCSCSANDSPDDMTLGMCLQRLAIPVTHSPLFHQARPDDYSARLLSHQRPVSFHKHWMVDPLKVYAKWFAGRASGDREEL